MYTKVLSKCEIGFVMYQVCILYNFCMQNVYMISVWAITNEEDFD